MSEVLRDKDQPWHGKVLTGINLKSYFRGALVVYSLLIGLFVLNGCGASEEKIPLRVAAAGNISFVADAIKKDFTEKYPEIDLEFSFASSGKLAAQIMNGAPFDVFLSADMGYPERLYNEGLTKGEPQVYANGKLVMFTAGKMPLKPDMRFVLEPEIKILAIANPKLATYGTAAAEALTKSGVYEQVKTKFVIGENIFQTVQFTLSAADVGFIAKSALYTPTLSPYKTDSANWWPVPDSLYQPIRQGMVLLEKSAEKKPAQTFMRYIRSESAKNIFKDYGYYYDT